MSISRTISRNTYGAVKLNKNRPRKNRGKEKKVVPLAGSSQQAAAGDPEDTDEEKLILKKKNDDQNTLTDTKTADKINKTEIIAGDEELVNGYVLLLFLNCKNIFNIKLIARKEIHNGNSL